MSIYTTTTFWVGAGERAIKTAAQTMLALVTVGTAVTALDWTSIAAITATATIASVLTSIADPKATATDAEPAYALRHRGGDAA
ncbi:hypothetical protein I6B53_03215 [Schaalia sp. 19OD2882]|uniref:holin n=1 Tax=Schaalia sp. 19OD2882 TaxID=2794089 RepID=UPI001C1F0A09|nr:holin [Schaalia sp. 19OD2882]QWW20120.1 hypothetical protein I6B53_03215 [Schaalia sp. 19OD2882]